jgi:hypothetical protein
MKVEFRKYKHKVIRPVERYIESAKTEAKVLDYIMQRDKNQRSAIVRLYQTFEIDKNYFMIFEKVV